MDPSFVRRVREEEKSRVPSVDGKEGPFVGTGFADTFFQQDRQTRKPNDSESLTD